MTFQDMITRKWDDARTVDNRSEVERLQAENKQLRNSLRKLFLWANRNDNQYGCGDPECYQCNMFLEAKELIEEK